MEHDAVDLEQRLGDRASVDTRRSLVRKCLEGLHEAGLFEELALAQRAPVPGEDLRAALEREAARRASRACARASREAELLARASSSAGSQSRRQGRRPNLSASSPSAAGRPGTAHDAAPIAYTTSSSPNAMGSSASSAEADGTAANPSRFMTLVPSNTMAWQPARRPLITVSATQDASAIATTASAAVPPSARISAPTSAVAG